MPTTGDLTNQNADENEAKYFSQIFMDENDPFDEDYSKLPQWWDNTEDVVISGISGRFPESQSVVEFMENLLKGVDCITEDNRRWDPGFYGLPKRHGKIPDLSKFDAAFFGVHPKQASNMDPQIRLLLETAYEAIYDAGINPHSLRNTKSGVFVGNAASETSSVLVNDPETIQGYALTGTTRSMFSNRLSYCLDFKGPSFTVDTACSSSLLAVQLALDSIRQGQCDQAIVAGAHITITPNSALQFLRLGMLSPEGKCKSFDANGCGYVRSECVGCVFLQKKSRAKRIYATILHAKSNTDGYKEQGITFPSGEQQINLMRDTYKEAGVDPCTVSYVEAHGTGTKVGDPQECQAITTVFTKRRREPMLIGSVKSNAGHAEPASGIMSLAKVIGSIERNIIPGNLHYQAPNPYIPSLTDGRLKVVAENTKFEPGLIGVSSFGFGGSNTHVILKPNPVVERKHHFDGKKKEIPILLVHSARTQEALENILTTFENNRDDLYLYNMLIDQSATPPNLYPYRGYSIINRGKADKASIREVAKTPNLPKRPIYFVYTGMGSQWAGMGRELMRFDVFRKAVTEASAAIEPLGINPLKLIMEGEDSDFEDNTLNCFVCITSIQMAMTDLLRYLGIKEDGVIGHSTGEMAASYADGCTNYAETMLMAYHRGRTILEAKFPPGGMAAIGLSWENTVKRLPEGVYPACHNAPDSVTISGDADKVTAVVNKLSDEGVFVKPVDSSGIAFHSPCMQIIANDMRNALLKVLPNPKLRSARWISSSIPDNQLNSELAKYSSADYHVNNMVSTVLFNTAVRKIPENSIIIEVAPHCLLQAILKRGIPRGCQCFGLMSNRLEKHENNMDFFLANLGKIYQAGANFHIERLYPKVEWPAPRGTLALSNLFGWEHGHNWEVLTGPVKMLNCVCSFHVDPFASDSMDRYILDHSIDGRPIYPFTGYMTLAWKAICKLRLIDFNQTSVIIENAKVIRATILNKPVRFDVVVTLADGNFEILEDDNLCASGTIAIVDDDNETPFFYEHLDQFPTRASNDEEKIELTTADIYKEFLLRGYEYGPSFRGIQKACNSGETATLLWTGNWVTYMDTLLQTSLILENNDSMRVPVRLRYLRIDPTKHMESIQEIDGIKVVRVRNNVQTMGVSGGGVEICDLVCQTVPRRNRHHNVNMERITFMPFKCDNCMFEYPELQQQLHDYNDACRALVVNGVKNLLKSGVDLPKKEFFEKIVEIHHPPEPKPELAAAYAVNPKCALYNFLNDIFSGKMSAANLAEEIKNAAGVLEKDMLWNFSWCDRSASDELDIALQNTKGHYHKFAVMEPSRLHVTKTLQFLHNIHPLLESEWLLVGAKVEKDLNIEECATNKCQVQRFDLNGEEDVSDLHKNQDIVVLDRILHKKIDIGKYLSKVKQFMRDDGFALITEITGNFETALFVEALQDALPKAKLNGARKYGAYYEHTDWCQIFEKAGFHVCGFRSENLMTTLYAVRKIPSYTLDPVFVKCEDFKDFTWVEPLQNALESRVHDPPEKTVYVYSNEVRDNGLVGLTISFKEELTKRNRVRNLIDLSLKNRSSPAVINKDDPELQKLLKQDLLSNTYRDGNWGIFTHLILREDQRYAYEETEHAFVNILVRGDLSSLNWISSPNIFFEEKQIKGLETASIYYASLNFRDIMLASGRLAPDAIPKAENSDPDCLLGMEFTGRDNKTGSRIMCIAPSAQALATTIAYDPRFSWGIPDAWTMEQAATVPVAYSTAYYALHIRGKMKKGETALIHAGSGGVGLAAIQIAYAAGCKVFTTVSSDEKKQFLLSRFSQLRDNHVCNSRSIEFEMRIKQMTMGRGVDIVLNSLSDDKLQASVRCLAQHGRFLEIGKFDLSMDAKLGMSMFLKNTAFHGVLMDSLINDSNNTEWVEAAKLLSEGILKGDVVPLPSTVFEMNKPEDAFRYMSHGKHIGKVMLKIRSEEAEQNVLPKPVKVKAIRRTHCHPQHVYVLVGGLGGFGLELAKWLISRGAKKLVLCGRTGVKTGYQARCLWFWRNAGIKVKLSLLDISNEARAMRLIEEAQELGPVGGVFNLGMVLKDTLFENQTPKNFQESCAPKYHGTRNLDLATRKLCGPELKWFVFFSSLVADRGNAGQTSYGFANSAGERVIEQRRYDGLPGMAIEWGAIGDVGVVVETMGDNNTVVAGTMPQRISSCMQSMDTFLCLNHPIVGSFIKVDVQSQAGNSDEDILESVARILGVNDPSQLNIDANMGDLGLDSLMGIEIKQSLERDYDIVLSMKDIRGLTLRKLRSLAKTGKSKKDNDDTVVEKDSSENLQKENIFGIRFRVDLNTVRPDITCLKLNDVTEGRPIFFVHSIEGVGSTLTSVAKQLTRPAYCFQLTPNAPTDCFENLAEFYIKEMQNIQPKGPFCIIGYSYGACIGLEIATQLQKGNPDDPRIVHPLIMMDGSHHYMRVFRKAYRRHHNLPETAAAENNAYIESELLANMLMRFSTSDFKSTRDRLVSLLTVEDRLNSVTDTIFASGSGYVKDKEVLKYGVESYLKKMLMGDKYNPTIPFKGDITLIRAKVGVGREDEIGRDYGLGEMSTGTVHVFTVEGDHDTFIHNESAIDCAKHILDTVSSSERR